MLDIRLVPAGGRALEPLGDLPAADVLAVPVRRAPAGVGSGGRPVPDVAGVRAGDLTEAELAAFAADCGADGTPGRVDSLPRPGRRPRLACLVGVGTAEPRELRRAAAALVRAVGRRRRVLAVLVPQPSPEQLRAIVEGLGLAAYRFSRASRRPTEGLRRVDLAVADPGGCELVEAVARGLAAVRAVHLARDLTNTPAAEKTPAWLGATVARALEPVGVRVLVRDERWLAEHGFGGVLAVGGGSARPPRLIEARWRPGGTSGPHVVLVGKGITFDSGGLSIKPADAMTPMKTDMAGGAAVLAAVQAAAALGLPVRVTALVPAAENHVSGSAYRPGDVIRQHGGRTTEVLNTDAEGRLVLADALDYGVRRYQPDAVVDVATLTGAMKVSLGLRTAGLFATDDALAAALLSAAAVAGEPAWRMPLVEDYLPKLRSEVADAVNAPPGSAGAIVAALFLRPFAGGLPWAHLDIAGPARAGADDGEITRGGTGYAVRLLLRWLESLAAASAG